MNNTIESWNQAAVLPEKEDHEIIVYYSCLYKGVRVTCYEVCNYDGDWNFDYPLPRKAKIHTWKYLDTWMNSDSARRYKRKPHKQNTHRRDKSKLWLSDDARLRHHCFTYRIQNDEYQEVY